MKSAILMMSVSLTALALPTVAPAQAAPAASPQSDPRGQAPASGPVGQSTGGETVAVPPTGGTQPAEAPSAEGSAAAQSGRTAGGEGLEDIIVTAAKVESNVQKVPVAIQTFSGEELLRAGVTNVQELNKLLPGVQVQQSGGGSASFFVRGIGSAVLNAFADPANAFSVDGVFFSRPSGPGTTLFDVARIEVLKGPQGTLYGRNATGGAFNVITNRPTQTLGGEGGVEFGNYDQRRVNAAINVPLTPELAIRVAGQISRHDGYLSDGYDDERNGALRVSALWKPSPSVTVYLSGDYGHTGGQGSGQVPVGPSGSLISRFVVPGQPRVGPSDPRIRAFTFAQSQINTPGLISNTPTTTICLGARLPGSPINGSIPICSYPFGVQGVLPDGFVDNDTFGFNGTVDLDLGIGTLTSIAGYRGTKTFNRFYIDPTPQVQKTDVDQYSFESRLASNDNGQALRWIVGGFFLTEQQNFLGEFKSGPTTIPNPQPAPGSALPATVCLPSPPGAPVTPVCPTIVTVIQDRFTLSLPNVKNETYAAFGQATYSLTDFLRATAGVRYTHEKKSSTDGISSQFFVRPAGVSTSYPSEGSIKFNDTSVRAGIEADVAPRSMVYAAYSTAYHAGGLNLGVPNGPNTYVYLPEEVKSYTIGSKNRFFNNRLQLNIEGFWLDYTNLQVSSLNRINDGSVACSTLGIAAACPLALRTDNAGRARFRGIEGDIQWQVWEGGLLFGNALYNDSRYLRFSTRSQAGVVAVYDGNRVSNISKVTVSGGFSQQIALGTNGYTLIPEVRTLYRSAYYVNFQQTPAAYQKGYTRTDLTVTLQAPERAWSIGAYIRNLENKATLLQGTARSNIATAPFQNLNPPLTFGAFASARF